jgi:hypothetical protein
MKKILIHLSLLLLLLSSILLQAQTESYDAEYLKLVKEYTLNEDGSTEFHYFKEIKLNTYFAFHRLFGETFIVYNPEYQELKINEAFTVMADGKKVIAPANAFNEVLPGFARDIPAYNHLREMVVTHTGTEIGCVITLDYTIRTKPGFQPQGFQPQGFQPGGFQPGGFQPFFGSEEIGDIVPIKDLTIIINVPQNLELKHRMLNNRTAPSVTESNGKKVFTWSLRDVKALSHAANQDPDQKQILFFTMAKDMTQAFYAFVNQDAFKSQPGPEISKRVDAAVKDKPADLDKILALQTVVIDELKLADIPLIYSGYKVRTPAAVWKSANATSLEKAILLAEMLKLANINAYPVATVSNGWYSTEMGNPAVFDGYMVQANPRETGRIYLSVTQKQSQNLIFDVQDKTMIQLDGAIESMRTFKEKGEVNLLEMEGKIRQGDRETGGQGDMETGRHGDKETWRLGELEIEMSGICNPYYKLRKDSSYVKNMISGDFPASSIKTIEQDQIAELKSKYLITKNQEPITNIYNGFLYLDLPRFKTGFDAWNLVQFTTAGDTPVKLDFPLKEEYSYEVSLTADYVLFTPPVEINIKNDLGELVINISQSGSTVKIERSWEIYKDVVTADLMDEFKEMILAWEKADYKKIVIKNDPR